MSDTATTQLPYPRYRDHSRRGSWEKYKSQKNRKSAVSLLEVSEKLPHEVSPIWLPRQDLNKDSIVIHANVDGRMLVRP